MKLPSARYGWLQIINVTDTKVTAGALLLTAKDGHISLHIFMAPN